MNDLDAAHSTPFAGLKPELVALARLARLAYAADAVRPHCDGPQPREPDVLAEVRADMLDGFHTILCGAGLMHTDGHEVDELALAEALVSSVLPAEEPAHPRVRVRAPSRPVTMKEAA